MKFINAFKRKWKTVDQSWRVAVIAFLIMRFFYTFWSWFILTIQPVSIFYFMDTGEKPGVVFFNLHTSESFNYLREIDGRIYTFKSADQGMVVDTHTNSLWDIKKGLSIHGPLTGTRLQYGSETSERYFPYKNIKPYPIALLAVWQRFDANWYVTIADFGYPETLGAEHFPPFYPLLIKLITPVFGNSFITGVIISHLATLIAIKLLFDLFNQWNSKLSRRAILYYLIFPTSFFLFSAYSESLFIVLTLLALRAMKKNDWLRAGFWVFCATLTRLQGLVLVVPMLYLMWMDHPFFRKLNHWTGMAVSGTGILFYFFLRYILSTDTVIPITESAWPTRLAPPWEAYWYGIQTLFSKEFYYIDFLNLVTATLVVFLLYKGWRKIPLEYNLYTISSLFIISARIVNTQPLSGMLRFSLALFPIYFVISFADNHPIWRRVVLYTSIALNMYLSAVFFSWGWVA